MAFFPKKKIKVKSKDIQSPWITARIRKLSKCKQQLYEEKFLKCRSERNDKYKNYKRLLETTTTKKTFKKNFTFLNTKII